MKRTDELKAFLSLGRIEIDSNPAKNAIRPNGIDFHQYLVKLFTDLPNLPIHQQPDILKDYMPWCKIAISLKISRGMAISCAYRKGALFYILGLLSSALVKDDPSNM